MPKNERMKTMLSYGWAVAGDDIFTDKDNNKVIFHPWKMTQIKQSYVVVFLFCFGGHPFDEVKQHLPLTVIRLPE